MDCSYSTNYSSINIFWKSGVCKQYSVQYIITYVLYGGVEIVLE